MTESQNLHIRLISFPIPLMVESADSGLFIELVHAIKSELDHTLDISLEVWPTPRAIQYFSEQQFDILFPGLDTLFPKSKNLLRSRELMYVKKDYVFTLKDRPVITTIADLKGLTVGLTRSYPYARDLLEQQGINYVYVNSDEQNANMLSRERIDAFIVEESSGLQAFRKTGLAEQVHYAPASPISSQDVYFAFQDTERGKMLEALVSKALKKLKQSGEFTRIMSGALTTGLEEVVAE